jgi:hypothetical protein
MLWGMVACFQAVPAWVVLAWAGTANKLEHSACLFCVFYVLFSSVLLFWQVPMVGQ